ncbi:MAG: hypothetical protein IK012_08935 [Fibrobacter sp.]|uniref:hypothetical protein n=1 Tax=Fibrobacter sp. TaxID=35828 RepID=UPI0025B93F25|nr:hypothetical protein [Fibrobacter sp.]MBR4785358.1 hypothetical protein [Fibrobacter sp.]
MDIKKCKIEKNREWSQSTQKNLASMLGITAALSLSGATLTACGDVVAGGDIETIESSSSEQITDGTGLIDEGWQDVSSSSEKTPNSSSLEPTSGISSSSMAPRPMSSSEILQPGIPLQESSSSYKIDTLEVTAGEVYIEPESGSNIDTGHLESSSSVAEPSSSSEPEPLPGDPIETIPVEVGPILAGVIENTPVRMDEPEQ